MNKTILYKRLCEKYNSEMREHMPLQLLIYNYKNKNMDNITTKKLYHTLDMSYLNKDPKIEKIKNDCKRYKEKKELINKFQFFIYLLAILGAIHTIIFYINLFVK